MTGLMRRAGVVVLGSANVDISLSVTALPTAGQTVLASELRRGIGGKGLNQAIASARAGAQTTMLASVGDDADGRAVRELLQAEGMSATGLRTVEEPTGTAVVIVDAQGENTIIVAPLANRALVDLTREDEALVDSCALLLCQLEVPLATVAAALRRAHASGARTVLNAAPAATLPASMTGLIDVLVVNEGEARTVADGGPAGATGSELDRLLTVSPEVVVTRGPDGADYANRDGDSVHIAAPRVRAVDSTGAGDAFCGALCARLVGGDHTVDALRVAVAAGAWSVQRRGTVESIPSAADLGAGFTAERPAP